jgi:hypothetical protein
MMQVTSFWRLGNLPSIVALRLCQASLLLSLPYPGLSFASSIFLSTSFGAPGTHFLCQVDESLAFFCPSKYSRFLKQCAVCLSTAFDSPP